MLSRCKYFRCKCKVSSFSKLVFIVLAIIVHLINQDKCIFYYLFEESKLLKNCSGVASLHLLVQLVPLLFLTFLIQTVCQAPTRLPSLFLLIGIVFPFKIVRNDGFWESNDTRRPSMKWAVAENEASSLTWTTFELQRYWVKGNTRRGTSLPSPQNFKVFVFKVRPFPVECKLWKFNAVVMKIIMHLFVLKVVKLPSYVFSRRNTETT